MGTSVKKIQQILQRFLNGTTGMGLIDASQRELWHTGYTSNRARQNVASFLTKHLGIDWRYGAEWYEYLLVDYDVSSNWSNWQYVAGVGNDPRGDNRIFNPVKQAFDYDKSGEYVKAWVVETREIEKLENVFQLWTTPQEELERLGLSDSILVTDPIKKIEFSVEGKPKTGLQQSEEREG
ncbi:DASH family cryptochrome [Colletotrichum higginsianum]|nr:DASH family cryptochrome [Colletotrichum higginsianum]